MTNISFLLISLIQAFTLTEAMTNLLLFPLRKMNRLLVYCYLFLCQFIFARQLGQHITVFTIGGTLLIIILSSKNIVTSSALSLFGYLLAIFIDYLLVAPLNLLGVSIADIYANNYYLYAFVVTYSVLTCVSTRFIGIYLRKLINKYEMLFTRELQILFSLETITCAILFILNIIQGENSGYPAEVIYFNTILFGVFFIITLIIFFFCLKIMQKNHDLSNAQREKESLEEYMKKLEDLYQDMRIFRHDYSNILSTMKYYIDNDDPQQLREYFQSKILPTSTKLADKDATIGKLSNIKLLELKGILYTKLIAAMNLDLNITLEIQEEINSISMEMIDLSTVVGALMDNAIEAAKESQPGNLSVALINTENSVIIIIANSTDDVPIPLDSIYEKDISSKPNHNGLGLYSVKTILEKYDNTIHSTNHIDNIFKQTIEILKR